MSSKLEKLEKRLQLALEERNFYEAHQIARTIYYRYVENDEYSEVQRFLYATFLTLYEAKQYASALDLAELYADTLQKSQFEAHNNILDPVIDMYSKLFEYSQNFQRENTSTNGSGLGCRKNLCNKVLNWSLLVAKTKFDKTYGLPKVHLRFARVFAKEKNFEAAKLHFLFSKEPEEFADYLVEYYQSQENTKGRIEKENLVAQEVFQCLFFKKIKDAVLLFQRYTDKHPEIGYERPYKFPLLNFLWILLRSVYAKNLSNYTIAIEAYTEVLHSTDSNFFAGLDRIGQIYFGIPSQKPSSHGFLSSILSGLMGSANKQPVEEDEEDEDWEDAGDTQEFLTDPLPVELLLKIKQLKNFTQNISQGPQTLQKDSEMDLD